MSTVVTVIYLLGVGISILAFTKGSTLLAKRSLKQFQQEILKTYGKESDLTYEELKSSRGAYLIVLESLIWPIYLVFYYGPIALMYVLIKLGG